jgi:hypothetical protein
MAPVLLHAVDNFDDARRPHLSTASSDHRLSQLTQLKELSYDPRLAAAAKQAGHRIR